jgi:hypothetical protein
MSKHVIECAETGVDRAECPCPKCSEYRAALAELVRQEAQDRIWNGREQSRRVDQEYVRRRM